MLRTNVVIALFSSTSLSFLRSLPSSVRLLCNTCEANLLAEFYARKNCTVLLKSGEKEREERKEDAQRVPRKDIPRKRF